jgi:uncharacterized protein YgiB involved in biofilm formation
MKRSRTARLVLMGLAPVALVSCGETAQEAFVFESVEQCLASEQMTATECQAAQATAQKEAVDNSPRYANRADCVADFGEQQCATQPHSSGFFMPLMTGFLLARALDNRSLAPQSQPLYRPRGGEWTTAGGYNVGRQTGAVRVPPAATQPQRAVTQSRAGFGTRAATRGTVGG